MNFWRNFKRMGRTKKTVMNGCWCLEIEMILMETEQDQATLRSQDGVTSSRLPPSWKRLPTTWVLILRQVRCHRSLHGKAGVNLSPRCTVDEIGGAPIPPTSAGLPSPSPAKSSSPLRRWESWNLVMMVSEGWPPKDNVIWTESPQKSPPKTPTKI